MPSIDDFKQKDLEKKKFKKTPYRPWNDSLSEDLKEPKNLSTENATNSQPIIYQNATNSKSIIYQNATNNKPTDNQNVTKDENTEKGERDENQVFTNFRRLSGLQKNIVIYIGSKCIYNNSLCSDQVKTKDLVKYLNTDSFTIRTAIQRIQKKGLLLNKEGKKGVGGFTIFYISEDLKKIVETHIKDDFFAKNFFLNITNSEPIINHTLPTSSSILNTTTKEPVDNFFENDFEENYISPLKKIGFSKKHLTQILKTARLDFDDVILSIQHFAFDLEENKKHEKIKGSPLNYFMGILLKGTPYNAPENYENPQKKALKEFIQRKERERREIEALEEKAIDLMYDGWVKTVSEDLVAEIIPEPHYRSIGSPFREGSLKKHFKENVWPSLRA